MGVPAETRVIACLGGEATREERRVLRAPEPGEMILALRVVGLCGTDLFKLATGAATPGLVLGHELVGTVAAVGEGVARFALGDRVVVPHHVPCGQCALCRRGSETMCAVFRENLMEPGGFADHVTLRPRAVAEAALKIPEHVADAAAVFVEPAACVLRGVERAALADGATAAVMGAGSMGLLHLLVLRARHPELAVLVIDPVAERRHLATSLGAAAVAAPGDAAARAARVMSDDLGVDAVFDTVGGAQVLAAGLALTRQGGTVVLFAHAPDGQRADFDLNSLFKYERRVLGTYSGALREQHAVFAMLVDGRFDPTPLVTHTLPLAAFDEGVALTRRRVALKVLYTP